LWLQYMHLKPGKITKIMTKDEKVIAGVLVTGALIGVGVGLYNYSQKNKLVNDIMEIGKNIPMFDGSPEILKQKSLQELKQIKQSLLLVLDQSRGPGQIDYSPPSFTDPLTSYDPRPTDAEPQQF